MSLRASQCTRDRKDGLRCEARAADWGVPDPAAVNNELNGVMGVDRRAEASKEQLREGMRYVGDRLRALGKPRAAPGRDSGDRDAGATFSGDPPF